MCIALPLDTSLLRLGNSDSEAGPGILLAPTTSRHRVHTPSIFWRLHSVRSFSKTALMIIDDDAAKRYRIISRSDVSRSSGGTVSSHYDSSNSTRMSSRDLNSGWHVFQSARLGRTHLVPTVLQSRLAHRRQSPRSGRDLPTGALGGIDSPGECAYTFPLV